MATEVLDIFVRLAAAGLLGACIGYERRVHHKAIGIAGMVLIAIGSTTYMLLGRHLAVVDPSSISRTLQGFLSGIGFLGGPSFSRADLTSRGSRLPLQSGLPELSVWRSLPPIGGLALRSG